MNSLIAIHNGTPTTTSVTIAEGTKRSHKNILELIRKYQPDLEEFGSLAFQTRVMREDGRGGQKTEIAILNERQATLVMTYMRNTPTVREFKKRLVMEFYKLAEAQANLPPRPPMDPEEVMMHEHYDLLSPMDPKIINLLPHHSDPSYNRRAKALIVNIARELSDKWRVFYMRRLEEDVLRSPFMRAVADRSSSSLMQLALSYHEVERDTLIEALNGVELLNNLKQMGSMRR